VPLVDEEKTVEEFAADGADEAFGDRVRTRRTHRCLDDLDVDGGEHGVEGGELAVAVADQEPDASVGVVEVHEQVAGLLGQPRSGRVGGDAQDVYPAGGVLDEADSACAPAGRRGDGVAATVSALDGGLRQLMGWGFPAHGRLRSGRLGGVDIPRMTECRQRADVLVGMAAAQLAGEDFDGIAEGDWTDAIDMAGAQVAVADYCPNWWPAATRLLIRRVRLDVEGGAVSADPRARRRRTLHPDQRALPLPELAALAAADPVYGYLFIVTNLDVTTGEAAAAVEHWYRHRTSIENLFRREPVPGRQTWRRAAPPALRLPRGQPGVDVGRAARGKPDRLAAPAHRHPHRRRQLDRTRRPGRPGHDRDPAAPADPRPRPARDSRRRTEPAPATRQPPAQRGPRLHPRPTRDALTRPIRPRTLPDPRHPRRHSGLRADRTPNHPAARPFLGRKRSPDRYMRIRV
jgi:hypothetical protein